MNFVDKLLEESSRRYGDKLALSYRGIFKSEKFSYRELEDLSGKVAKRLMDDGYKADDKVLIWGENSPYWVIAYFGILRAGCVAVPVTAKSTKDIAQKYAKKTSAKAIIVSQLFVPNGSSFHRGVDVVHMEDILVNLPTRGGSRAR